MNQGNHFREPDIRIAKAFAWVMEENNMWILFAFGSALFAGLTAILAKCGIRNTDSNVATALRTGVVLVFSWLMVFVVGAQSGIRDISAKVLIFLILSGLSTGISWLCYFKALQIGDINKVTPIDKSSTVITMLLAFIFSGRNNVAEICFNDSYRYRYLSDDTEKAKQRRRQKIRSGCFMQSVPLFLPVLPLFWERLEFRMLIQILELRSGLLLYG